MKYSRILSTLLLTSPVLGFTLTPATSSRKSIRTTNIFSTKEVNELSYAGSGAPIVDMNKYNLSLSKVAEELTAVMQQGTSMMEEGIFLAAKNDREHFTDTLQYKVKRDGGLGLILTELAGGREDGLGITIVEELVEGGNGIDSGIIEGDSIVALTVIKSSGGVNVQEERVSVATECFGYDKTVESIVSLPPPTSADEEVLVTVKRLRRKPRVTVKLQYPPYEKEPDTVLELFAGENLRRALLTRGVKLNDVLSKRFDSGGTGDCGADGTCATCAVGVVRGGELLSPKKQTESQIFADTPSWRMACKTIVGHGMSEGDLTLQVNPKQWSK